jgi:hypothetical protein
MAELPRKHVERIQSTRLATLFLDRVQAAKLDAGTPRGFCGRDAFLDEFACVLIDVEAKLFRHVVLKLIAIAQHANERANAFEHGVKPPRT